MNKYNFENRNAVITGGAQGFGFSMVESLLITLGLPCIVLALLWFLHFPHVVKSYVKLMRAQ